MPRGSGSGQDKDAGPNYAANTQENELPAMQFSPKMTFSITRLTELIHRLCSENVHNAFPAEVIHPYRERVLFRIDNLLHRKPSFSPEARMKWQITNDK